MRFPITIKKIIDRHISDFCESLPRSPGELYEPIRYILTQESKKIRPLFLLLTCKMFNNTIKEAIPAAIAIELFHTFTLIHDDIADNATMRRNNPAIHIKWNSSIAMLAGDTLMIKAYQRLAETPQFLLPRILDVFNKTSIKVCEGQQLDLNYESEKKVTLDEYLIMIRQKTAALFSASMEIGAIAAGAEEKDIRKMKKIGESAGMLFQLQDDLLDVYGKPENTGKRLGGDIVNNKKTFLLIKALENARGKTRNKLKSLLISTVITPKEKIKGVIEIYDELDIKDVTIAQMKSYYNDAIRLLESYTNHPKEIFVQFLSNTMHRES